MMVSCSNRLFFRKGNIAIVQVLSRLTMLRRSARVRGERKVCMSKPHVPEARNGSLVDMRVFFRSIKQLEFGPAMT